jgi:hypothetical protein
VVDSSEGTAASSECHSSKYPGGCACKCPRSHPHLTWQVFHFWSLHVGMRPIVLEAMETATPPAAIRRLKVPKERSLVSKRVFYCIRSSHTCIVIPNCNYSPSLSMSCRVVPIRLSHAQAPPTHPRAKHGTNPAPNRIASHRNP